MLNYYPLKLLSFHHLYKILWNFKLVATIHVLIIWHISGEQKTRCVQASEVPLRVWVPSRGCRWRSALARLPARPLHLLRWLHHTCYFLISSVINGEKFVANIVNTNFFHVRMGSDKRRGGGAVLRSTVRFTERARRRLPAACALTLRSWLVSKYTISLPFYHYVESIHHYLHTILISTVYCRGNHFENLCNA